jgi:16S rRNA (adenine1518-N6/adenine1519-N6)-dimethyltransferase
VNDVELKRATEQLCARFGIAPSRSRDQHFLIDDSIAKKEIDLLSPKDTETILEIGPGLGLLTNEIAKRAKRLIAIEKDARLEPALRATLLPNVQLVIADATKLRLPPADKFFSNLPYSASRPLTIKLLGSGCRGGVLLVQEEFAQKLAAPPGSDEYGIVSVIAQYYADVTLADRVPGRAFTPEGPPSRIAVFRKKRVLNKAFEDFVKQAFAARRKKMPGFGNRRPEQLAVEEFITAFEASK